jgi:cell division septum initiation protein DivIVA
LQVGPEESNENVTVVQRLAAMESAVDGPQNLDDVLREREELLAKVARLEAEFERYRAHAQRTRRMFQAATGYAEWVKENARRDAELTLRKARARADKTLGKLAQERERSERELARLQTLTAETRTRLSAFTAIALQVLEAQGVEGVQAYGASHPWHPTLDDDLKDALGSQPAAAAQQAAAELETR